MWKRGISLAAAIVTAGTFFVSGMCQEAFAAQESAGLTSLQEYPEVKKFDYTSEPVRENVSHDTMIDPDYGIIFGRTEPDEYFGGETVNKTDTVTGRRIKGIDLSKDAAKGGCGCIYRKLFSFRGRDIDVKTTYMDWTAQEDGAPFAAGGFAGCRWESMWRVEMKHEFFLAGTDTPADVKGFITYSDLDNSQGICIEANKLDDIWVNSGETKLGYRNVKAGENFVQNSCCSWQTSSNMLCIQSMTDEDISDESSPGYSPVEGAEYSFSMTFGTDVLLTCLIDNDTAPGMNSLEGASVKKIPSAFPEDSSECLVKTVSDDDRKDASSNSVRSWERWTYRIKVNVPAETEEGNMYDSFGITDSLRDEIKIEDVKILRDGDEAGEKFTVARNGSTITASADSTYEKDFYGHEYCLQIDVSMGRSKDEMLEEGKLDDSYKVTINNCASAEYEDGNGTVTAASNETETEVCFEKEADIVITKKVKTEDIYGEHGDAVFLFNISGRTASGEKKEYNRAIIIDGDTAEPETSREYVTGTVTLKGVAEGVYTCREHRLFRFETEDITDILGGKRQGDQVVFTIDSTRPCRATFINSKRLWSNYSDSSILVTGIGIK